MSTSNGPWIFTRGTTVLTFLWLRQDAGGVAGRATWSNAPREVVREYLGTSDADVATVGFTVPRIGGSAYIDPANIGPYLSLNGLTGVLSDGTFSWPAYLSSPRIQGLVFAEQEGAVVDLVFVRARPGG